MNRENHKDKLYCDLDGNALCIMKRDFIDLASSSAMFIKLNKKQLAEYQKLLESKNTIHKVRRK